MTDGYSNTQISQIPVSNNLTMSSREIADLCGKRHDNVMSDIRKMFIDLGLNAPDFSGTYKTDQGNVYECFNLPKRESLILVSGYNINLRAKIIDRWAELESALIQPALPDLSTHEGTLLALRNLTDKTIALVSENKLIASERDHAVATKAQIGSRREATAMAKASIMAREANNLRSELGKYKEHATVRAVENLTKNKYEWRPLKRWCDNRCIKPEYVPDKLYGEVCTWPAEAWLDVHNVDLSELFKLSVVV